VTRKAVYLPCNEVPFDICTSIVYCNWIVPALSKQGEIVWIIEKKTCRLNCQISSGRCCIDRLSHYYWIVPALSKQGEIVWIIEKKTCRLNCQISGGCCRTNQLSRCFQLFLLWRSSDFGLLLWRRSVPSVNLNKAKRVNYPINRVSDRGALESKPYTPGCSHRLERLWWIQPYLP
jgi:hypothetical protein